jgi:eukaryotic-like serine/threonine-protein kinase
MALATARKVDPGGTLDSSPITAMLGQVMRTGVEAGDCLLAEGTRVGDFRIRGLLGEGAMGQVYLAQDIMLGRRIALKLIKRSVMQSDGVDRFLEEARATASFNHPHIVTIHAVGEHEGRPYLALEYIDGESLRARLAAGPLPVREALRYCKAVAEAIAEAHRRDLVHADLKPDNIVLSRDGRVRVVDFGLARFAGTSPNNGSGTPAYMAPERWYGVPPGGAIDVWAFGIMLHELVTGHRPIPDAALARFAFSNAKPDLSSLPVAPWAAIVRDCLALDPAARPTAEELVNRITALAERRGIVADGDPRCPFPGLAAFSRDHAADYLGRRAKLDVLVEQLRARALIPVVGPAGIGKSSFIRAALLPRLDETGRWIAISLSPGASPFDSLAAALALPGRPAAEVADALRRDPDGLARALGEIAQRHGARVLLCLDQFEETFTLAASKAEASAFCDCIGRAARAAEPWRIVLALRDDFLDRLTTARSLRPHLGGVMRLGPLSAADLRAAIVRPLVNAGYEADAPELVARILDDVEGQPACLALLQLTCQSLWQRRDVATRRILTSEYEAMGGAAGALAGQARCFLAELSADELQLARTLLVALYHADGSPRPRRRAELVGLVPGGARDGAGRLLERLLERRILVEVHPARTLAIAHDALDAAWPQLARWLDETHDERLALAELEEAAQVWQRRGQRDRDIWSEAALARFSRKAAKWDLLIPPAARAFLDASLRNERRFRRRWGWLAVAVSVLAIALAIGSLTLLRRDADRARSLTPSKTLRAERAPIDVEDAPGAAAQDRLTSEAR